MENEIILAVFILYLMIEFLYEWIIDVEEHAIKNGIKIPVKMKAGWQLENKFWTWLELEVVDIRYNNHQ